MCDVNNTWQLQIEVVTPKPQQIDCRVSMILLYCCLFAICFAAGRLQILDWMKCLTILEDVYWLTVMSNGCRGLLTGVGMILDPLPPGSSGSGIAANRRFGQLACWQLSSSVRPSAIRMNECRGRSAIGRVVTDPHRHR